MLFRGDDKIVHEIRGVVIPAASGKWCFLEIRVGGLCA